MIEVIIEVQPSTPYSIRNDVNSDGADEEQNSTTIGGIDVLLDSIKSSERMALKFSSLGMVVALPFRSTVRQVQRSNRQNFLHQEGEGKSKFDGN